MSTLRLRAGEQLPASGFVDRSGGAVELRGRRGPLVVLAAHGKECRGCADWIRRLAAASDAIERWGATVFVVLPPGGWEGPVERELPGGVRLVVDGRGQVAEARGSAASVLVADEWGEIYFAQRAGDDSELPEVDEVEEWMRFVAIQCPECDPIEPPWGRV